MHSPPCPQWMQITLLMAGIYNILWGSWVVLFPSHIFIFAELEQPNHPWLWQALGMTILVFGVAYILAHKNPLRHWPIVAAGLLGRILGPIGFFHALYLETITWKFGITLLTNDAIWLIPFALILWKAYQLRDA